MDAERRGHSVHRALDLAWAMDPSGPVACARQLHSSMRLLATLSSVILASACSSSGRSSDVPDGGQEPPPVDPDDAGAGADAADLALQRAIVFSAAIDSQLEPDLYWMTSDGTRIVRLTSTPGAELFPTWSPDRTRVAFVRDAHLYVLEVDDLEEHMVAEHVGRGRPEPDSPHEVSGAAWSPDGTRLVYPFPRTPYPVEGDDGVLDQSYDTTLHFVNADGTNDVAYDEPSDPSQPPGIGTLDEPAWSSTDLIAFTVADDCPDCAGGSRYAFSRPDGRDFRNIEPLDLAEYPLYPRHGLDWSPDATRWVFTAMAESSIEAPGVIAVRSVDKPDDIRALTLAGTWSPRYSPDGASIAFLASDGIYVINANGTNQSRILGANGVRGIDW